MKLVRASGWSQAEVARRLHITPGAVSQLCHGLTRPSGATFNLFKYILEQEKPGTLARVDKAGRGSALEPWATQVLESLRRLRPPDRDRVVAALNGLIDAVAKAGRRIPRG